MVSADIKYRERLVCERAKRCFDGEKDMSVSPMYCGERPVARIGRGQGLREKVDTLQCPSLAIQTGPASRLKDRCFRGQGQRVFRPFKHTQRSGFVTRKKKKSV